MENTMQHFTFRFGGVNFNVQSDHHLKAMSEANDYFRPYGGAWFRIGTTNCYEWRTGNFFD
jgi:hypothetical protein